MYYIKLSTVFIYQPFQGQCLKMLSFKFAKVRVINLMEHNSHTSRQYIVTIIVISLIC